MTNVISKYFTMTQPGMHQSWSKMTFVLKDTNTALTNTVHLLQRYMYAISLNLCDVLPHLLFHKNRQRILSDRKQPIKFRNEY